MQSYSLRIFKSGGLDRSRPICQRSVTVVATIWTKITVSNATRAGSLLPAMMTLMANTKIWALLPSNLPMSQVLLSLALPREPSFNSPHGSYTLPRTPKQSWNFGKLRHALRNLLAFTVCRRYLMPQASSSSRSTMPDLIIQHPELH